MKILDLPSLNDLSELTPFKGISEEELNHILTLMQHRLYDSGETVIAEYEQGDNFYILCNGELRVTKRIESNEEETLNVIRRSGELFGEMSLVEDKPRSAAVVAETSSEVLSISKEGFLSLVNKFPHFTLAVARSISNYLRETDKTLISALEEKNQRLEATIQELEETRQALVDSERLSMIGRMAATIIHDLKNPMTTIGGFAQLLQMKDPGKDEVHDFAQMINRQVEQFSATAQELLTYAKGSSSAELKPMPLSPVLNDIIMGIAFSLAQKKMKLEKDFSYEGELQMDSSRFPRIVENLASNAIDAMDAGGTLSIATRVVGDQVEISVSDDGKGMSPDVMSQVFTEFFTHGKDRGTGLGLAITKTITEEHHGSISVQSTPGEGTVFTLLFPIP